jgi:hypothetical protein
MIGETSQLTATARFSDGTLNDVTTQAQWSSSDATVVGVSSTGLLTTLKFGSTVIFARYLNNNAMMSVRPTPAGTFVIAGWVREPGEGGIADVRVTDTVSFMTAQTGSGGRYDLVSLPHSEARLRFEKDGYEPAEVSATQNLGDASMQRTIRLRDGDTVSPPRFAPNDFVYMVGPARCFPCRLVRLVTGAAGTFHLRVTWNEPAVTISLWANGSVSTGAAGELAGDVLVPAGESIVYLGLNVPVQSGVAYHVPFTIETSFR